MDNVQLYIPPSFTIDTTLVTECLGFSESAAWSHCVDEVGLLLSNIENRKRIYLHSRLRYERLWPLRDLFFAAEGLKDSFCLLMAESLYWLSDTKDSLQLLLKLKQSLRNDTKLDALTDYVGRVYKHIEEEDLKRELSLNGVEGLLGRAWKEPPNRAQTTQEKECIDATMAEWEACGSELGVERVADIATRIAAIAMNEEDQVFQIDDTSRERLAREGFTLSSISKVKRSSNIRSPLRITDVLKRTLDCLTDIVSPVLSDVTSFTPALICSLHSKLTEGDIFTTDYDLNREVVRITLTPPGEYRVTGMYFDHYQQGNEKEFTCQYGSFTRFPALMEQFCQEVQQVLSDTTIDVFTKVGWLYDSFSSVIPFPIASSRIAVIIASIPLLQMGLPPLAVKYEARVDYYFERVRRCVLNFIHSTRTVGRLQPTPPNHTAVKWSKSRDSSRSSSTTGSGRFRIRGPLGLEDIDVTFEEIVEGESSNKDL